MIAAIDTSKYSQQVQGLLKLYDLFPFHDHPLWQAIIRGTISKEQVILAEEQHFLRTRSGRALRKAAVIECRRTNKRLLEAIEPTYIEECTDQDGTPTHLDLIINLCLADGRKREELNHIENTPGNIAAIALYKDIADRGPACHIIGAGVVEYYYSQLCGRIYESYINNYGFSPVEAETYRIHTSLDLDHAERAFEVIDEGVAIHGIDLIKASVRDAFIATSLHYDGMLQAALNNFEFWNGKK
ncbi:iron-containing redox enzyme family protein [Hymenobacter sp. DG25A]|uniref:iron-containing redox enzyme family protein n=1 Tax=Hymenobacter sp. DG25A TaxID=1385663 RepID=UPI0006BD221F|nr:iron-containing redox enzyme family protein [Hymenobacter sp. DG25A]ALD19924.1 hypothetical protein AM218_00080 [Hymenobacter sp. DG25A]